MQEKFIPIGPMHIDRIEVDGDGECEGDYGGEHMGYRITIVTDLGPIYVEGCHDGGPNLQDPHRLVSHDDAQDARS